MFEAILLLSRTMQMNSQVYDNMYVHVGDADYHATPRSPNYTLSLPHSRLELKLPPEHLNIHAWTDPIHQISPIHLCKNPPESFVEISAVIHVHHSF